MVVSIGIVKNNRFGGLMNIFSGGGLDYKVYMEYYPISQGLIQ